MQNYSNYNFLDPVGEKHNTWRTSRIPTLLVVVRNHVYISLTVHDFLVRLCLLHDTSCPQCVLGLVLCCTREERDM